MELEEAEQRLQHRRFIAAIQLQNQQSSMITNDKPRYANGTSSSSSLNHEHNNGNDGDVDQSASASFSQSSILPISARIRRLRPQSELMERHVLHASPHDNSASSSPSPASASSDQHAQPQQSATPRQQHSRALPRYLAAIHHASRSEMMRQQTRDATLKRESIPTISGNASHISNHDDDGNDNDGSTSRVPHYSLPIHSVKPKQQSQPNTSTLLSKGKSSKSLSSSAPSSRQSSASIRTGGRTARTMALVKHKQQRSKTTSTTTKRDVSSPSSTRTSTSQLENETVER
jgi:hypothetical protein